MFKPPRPDYIDYLPDADPPGISDGRIFDKEELAYLWAEAIRLVRPPLAQTLFQQQGVLTAIDLPYFDVGMKSKQLLRLAEQRTDKIEQAMSTVMGCSMTAMLFVLPKASSARRISSWERPRIVDPNVETLAPIWAEVVKLIQPRIAQTLFQQQAILLAIEPSYFRVGIKHKVLLRLAQQRAYKVEQAMYAVTGNLIKATFSVLPSLNQAASQYICPICQQPLEQVQLQGSNRSGALSMLRCSADAAHPVYFETEPGCFSNPGGVELLTKRSPLYP